ncbi:unnamed protein product [Arctia plantaginis]|uniref:Uncharacterized protein n=1 Tax=Arctia plantaginis TaxID=874455 RepID=A0A8S1A4U1_ARCPL|nr:unnamed protein product [Arctia plantaginis]
MLGQIGLAFGCVNYLSTPSENIAAPRPTAAASRQRVHPEDSTSSREKLAIPRLASTEDKTPSPNAFDVTIQPKISPLLASSCTPTTESRTMTLYGYNAAAKLPFAFSHGAHGAELARAERRSLRVARPPPAAGRMVRSASSGAPAEHAPAPPSRLVARAHFAGPLATHRHPLYRPTLFNIA